MRTIKEQIQSGIGDTETMQLLLKSRQNELEGRFTTSLELAERADVKGEELSFKKICKAYAYWRLNKYDKGIDLSVQVLNSENNTYLLGSASNILGLLYWKKQNYDIALNYIQAAINYRLDNSTKLELSYSINNRGNVYLSMGEYDKCKSNFESAMYIRNNLHVPTAIAASYNSLARYHYSIQNYGMALTFHLKSLKLWIEIGRKQFIGKQYRFLAITYNSLDNSMKALESIDQAIKIFEEIPNPTDVEYSYNLKEELYL